MEHSYAIGKSPQRVAMVAFIALLLAALVLPFSAAAKNRGNTAGILTSDAQAISAADGSVQGDGTFTVQKVIQQDGQLLVKGKLDLVLADGTQFTENVLAPLAYSVSSDTTGDVTVQQLTCDVLFLEIGPIDLELLGLIVHVDPIVIDIDADPSGGLLGQLLCSLAGGGPLQQIVSLLNQILAILQGL